MVVRLGTGVFSIDPRDTGHGVRTPEFQKLKGLFESVLGKKVVDKWKYSRVQVPACFQLPQEEDDDASRDSGAFVCVYLVDFLKGTNADRQANAKTVMSQREIDWVLNDRGDRGGKAIMDWKTMRLCICNCVLQGREKVTGRSYLLEKSD